MVSYIPSKEKKTPLYRTAQHAQVPQKEEISMNHFTSVFSREGVRINKVMGSAAAGLCTPGNTIRR